MLEKMDDGLNGGSFWLEEINGKVETPVRKKRKYKARKKEYNGWGSTSLIWFLKSIGRDTSTKIAQREVANIINEYIKQNDLFHRTKKKRVECDERLHLLFGRKTIARLKIYDLLESHFAENCEDSLDDMLFDSDDDENALVTCETPRTTSSERKIQPKKLVIEKPKSCFAAIVPSNIKLVYLKKSLVEDLSKDPESFETKVVGSFIRIKCDPNDYLQKNSHQLLQVTGIKKSSEAKGEIRLQASGFIKDIKIQMLSDDNFSEEECEDLHQRVKDGLVKRLMIVDIEQRARILHEDMTKHWLARELALLQNLIDRANEKGWRRELDEYLRKRGKLQSPDEQERLLHEIPQVIAEDEESESTPPRVQDKKVENNVEEFWQATCTKTSLVSEVPKAGADDLFCEARKLDFVVDLVKQESNSPKSILSLSGASEVPLFNMNSKLNCISHDTTAAKYESSELPAQQQPERQTGFGCMNGVSKSPKLNEAKHKSSGLSVLQQPELQIDFARMNGVSKSAESNEAKHESYGLSVQHQPEQQQTGFGCMNGVSKSAELNEVKTSQGPPNKQIQPSQIQVIELSDDDDDDNEKPSTTKPVPAEQLHSLMWHYRDPQGNVQGPFSLTSLKRWSDAGYFSRDFKVWKSGQSQVEGVFLVDILPKIFPI